MDNQNTVMVVLIFWACPHVLILVLMDNQNTTFVCIQMVIQFGLNPCSNG